MKNKFFKCVLLVLFFHSIVILPKQGVNSNKSEERAPVFDGSATQRYTISFQSNTHLDFYTFIGGINSVYVVTDEGMSPENIKDDMFYGKYRNLINTYLKGLGFENVAISSSEQAVLDRIVSLTQTATFKVKLDFTVNYISNVSFSFFTCNGDEFEFSKDVDYYINSSWDKFLLNTFKSMFWYSVPFNKEYSLKLNSIITDWTEKKLLDHFEKNGLTDCEGIYEKFGSVEQYKIGLVKDKDDYKIIYLSGARNNFDWKEGDLKGTIRETSAKNIFKVDWIMSDKSVNKDVYLSTKEDHFLNFEFSDPAIGSSSKYLKLYPPFSSGISVSKAGPAASGTGFVVSTDGLIITAHHVIEDGKFVTVQFADNGSVETYKTKVLLDDINNDLTVLLIDDRSFKTFDTIPYNITPVEEEIGTDVFTLGYPLIESLGESIKLNDGIISSNSGFLNDVQSYQVSIPIYPGNSGGPLFDKSGNVIGIVNAKYSSAENVAFAIKSPPVINLLKKLPASSTITTGFNYNNKPLTELVKSFRKYVCLVKVD